MNFSTVKNTAAEGARSFGSMVGQGIMGAAAGAAITGVTVAGQKAYDALTKARDFKNMMQSPWSADLQELHDQAPDKFNAAFTSLRRVNAPLTKDPMLASAYMRRMMQYDPAGATGVMVEALAAKDRAQPSGMMDAAARGAQTGIQHVFQDRANLLHTQHQLDVAHHTEREKLLARETQMRELGGMSFGDLEHSRQMELKGEEGRLRGEEYDRKRKDLLSDQAQREERDAQREQATRDAGRLAFTGESLVPTRGRGRGAGNPVYSPGVGFVGVPAHPGGMPGPTVPLQVPPQRGKGPPGRSAIPDAMSAVGHLLPKDFTPGSP